MYPDKEENLNIPTQKNNGFPIFYDQTFLYLQKLLLKIVPQGRQSCSDMFIFSQNLGVSVILCENIAH